MFEKMQTLGARQAIDQLHHLFSHVLVRQAPDATRDVVDHVCWFAGSGCDAGDVRMAGNILQEKLRPGGRVERTGPVWHLAPGDAAP